LTFNRLESLLSESLPEVSRDRKYTMASREIRACLSPLDQSRFDQGWNDCKVGLDPELKGKDLTKAINDKRQIFLTTELTALRSLMTVPPLNCFGAVIFSAVDSGEISKAGGATLLKEIDENPSAGGGGGLYFSKGKKDQTNHVLPPFNGITVNEAVSAVRPDQFEQLNSAASKMPPGTVVIFSTPGGWDNGDIGNSNKAYAHVAILGEGGDLIEFWGDNVEHTTVGDSAGRVLLESCGNKIDRETGISVHFLAPNWADYQI
jgi:hypothetical protein